MFYKKNDIEKIILWEVWLVKLCLMCNGTVMVVFIKNWVFRCTIKSCIKEYSVFKNISFYYRRLPISVIVEIFRLLFDNYSIKEISYRVEIDRRAVRKIIGQVYKIFLNI
ncbi:hypothetical protein DMUE_0802 [Dictyocoela muelleri]|nr:hypothetical protein DMUE_0802 [Dictyocoela muelleri]